MKIKLWHRSYDFANCVRHISVICKAWMRKDWNQTESADFQQLLSEFQNGGRFSGYLWLRIKCKWSIYWFTFCVTNEF